MIIDTTQTKTECEIERHQNIGVFCKNWEPYRVDLYAEPNSEVKVLCEALKEMLIKQALSTDEGSKALAAAMVEPKRGPLEYR